MNSGLLASTSEVRWPWLRTGEGTLVAPTGKPAGRVVCEAAGSGWSAGASLRHLAGSRWAVLDGCDELQGRILGPPSVENLQVHIVSADGVRLCSVIEDFLGATPGIRVFVEDQLVATIGGLSMSRVFAPDGTRLLRISRRLLTQRYTISREPAPLTMDLEEVVCWCGLLCALCRRLHSIRAATED